MLVNEKNHNWTMNGPDPKGVEVPEYLTIARNHLATRNIPLKEKDDGNLFLGILLFIFVGVLILGTFSGIALIELVRR